MAKKYRGQKCPYCTHGISDSDEHVLARKFFVVEDRGNLPKAPACKRCNNLKSELERYALEVLPFGARHHAAQMTMATEVPRRLAQNLAQLRAMKHGLGQAWVQERPDGIIMPTMTVPVDAARLKALFVYIVKGLLWYHWKVYLDPSDHVDLVFLTGEGNHRFREDFGRVDGEVTERDFGKGTIAYRGIQDRTFPKVTVWQFSILGGVCLVSGDPADGASSTIAAFTGFQEHRSANG